MAETLEDELAALPPATVERLRAHHFDRSRFLELASKLGTEAAVNNRVSGAVQPPEAPDFAPLPPAGSPEAARLRERGLALLREGCCALVVMAGGMATRMGGVVKALVEAVPGKTFLDLRLGEQAALERLAGRKVPLWLMTSASTDAAIRKALGSRLDGDGLAVFPQRLAVRLTPEGRLFRDREGQPSEYAPGHGDLVDSLRDSGLLDRFVARGGRIVTVANLDNLGATLDPVLVGLHAAHGKPVTCEVVEKVDSDKGGIPVRHEGRAVILEEFRLPAAFDATKVRVFSTNTFHFDAVALTKLDARWSYFVVTKKVEERPAIQFERLIGEVTSFLDTAYVTVPRTGPESRFLPVKDLDELGKRRSEVVAVARSRGMMS